MLALKKQVKLDVVKLEEKLEFLGNFCSRLFETEPSPYPTRKELKDRLSKTYGEVIFRDPYDNFDNPLDNRFAVAVYVKL